MLAGTVLATALPRQQLPGRVGSDRHYPICLLMMREPTIKLAEGSDEGALLLSDWYVHTYPPAFSAGLDNLVVSPPDEVIQYSVIVLKLKQP